jgi:hypothetical protein
VNSVIGAPGVPVVLGKGQAPGWILGEGQTGAREEARLSSCGVLIRKDGSF